MVTLQEKKYYGESQFSSEKIAVVPVNSLDEFGHYLALDLLSWIDKNPTGVISLPTGRTPESFIRALEWYKENWSSDGVQQNIKKWGIRPEHFPETDKIRFVQMDEFLWMSPQDPQSYSRYILDYYISALEIPRENCLLIDFSAMGFDLYRVKEIVNQQGDHDSCLQDLYFAKAMQMVELFCEKYEQQIKSWGGIGYFLGGIGLDGHIAFNISGSSRDSVTRIVELNKKSKSGFKRSDRCFDRAATIGLKTILQNPDAVIVLGAVGKEKATIVQKVIEGPVTGHIPASCLQDRVGSRFVVTTPAAGLLGERNQEIARVSMSQSVPVSLLDKIVIQSALSCKKRIVDLIPEDFQTDVARLLFEKIKDDLDLYLGSVMDRIEDKINQGLQGWGSKRVLHTAPHHDDIMLGYYPVITQNVEAQHEMVYVVSGSNGISDEYLYRYLQKNKKEPDLVEYYQAQGGFKGSSLAVLMKKKIRESEAELLWRKSGLNCGVTHLRSPFYNASYFKSQPTYKSDVLPCLELIEKFSPEVVFVLNDSEFQGPNTHHASCKIVIEAIKEYKNPVAVLGYRNVWDRYQVDEASIIVPISQNEYNEQHQLFVDCFASQKKALYPSKKGSEPFSVYAQQIQKIQRQELVTLLGGDYFESHADQRIRSAVGFVLFEKVES